MKTRTQKKLVLILAISVLAWAIIGVVIPKFLNLNRYQGFIVSELEKAIGGTVELGHISWGFSHRIWVELDSLSITNASAFPVDIKLTRIFASISIPQLLSKKIVVNQLLVNGSLIKLRLDTATDKFSPPVDGKKYSGVHLPLDVQIRELKVTVNQLEIDETRTIPGTRQTHTFSDLVLGATNISPPEEIAFKLNMRDISASGLGSFNLKGTFKGLTKALTLKNPELTLQANLKNSNVNAFKHYFESSSLKEQLNGHFSIDVSYKWDLDENMSAQGVIDLGSVA